MQIPATDTLAAYHLIIDWMRRICGGRYGYVLIIGGTRTAGESQSLQGNERPVVYALKQL